MGMILRISILGSETNKVSLEISKNNSGLNSEGGGVMKGTCPRCKCAVCPVIPSVTRDVSVWVCFAGIVSDTMRVTRRLTTIVSLRSLSTQWRIFLEHISQTVIIHRGWCFPHTVSYIGRFHIISSDACFLRCSVAIRPEIEIVSRFDLLPLLTISLTRHDVITPILFHSLKSF